MPAGRSLGHKNRPTDRRTDGQTDRPTPPLRPTAPRAGAHLLGGTRCGCKAGTHAPPRLAPEARALPKRPEGRRAEPKAVGAACPPARRQCSPPAARGGRRGCGWAFHPVTLTRSSPRGEVRGVPSSPLPPPPTPSAPAARGAGARRPLRNRPLGHRHPRRLTAAAAAGKTGPLPDAGHLWERGVLPLGIISSSCRFLLET